MDSLFRSLGGRGCTRRRRLRRQSEKRRYSENPSGAVALDNKKCLFTAGLRTWWNVARSLKANDYARDRCVELESPRARTGHFYCRNFTFRAGRVTPVTLVSCVKLASCASAIERTDEMINVSRGRKRLY